MLNKRDVEQIQQMIRDAFYGYERKGREQGLPISPPVFQQDLPGGVVSQHGIGDNPVRFIETKDRCMLSLSVDQTISDGVATKIEWDVVDSDWEDVDADEESRLHQNTNVSDGTNLKPRITLLKSGFYLFAAGLTWDLNATGYRMTEVQKTTADGATTTDIAFQSTPSVGVSQETFTSVSGLVYLKEKEYLECLGTQTSGGNLDVRTASTFFSVILLSV